MEKIIGRIHNMDVDKRLFQIKINNKMEYFYLTRSFLKRFAAYFHEGLYVQIEYKGEKSLHEGVNAHEVMGFDQIFDAAPQNKKIYFNIENTKKTITKVLNKTGNKLFVDFEFSMPPYERDTKFISEIIQYGFIVESEDGQVLFEDSSLIKPTYEKGITDRTLDFLKLKKTDFDEAVDYNDFYQVLKEVIEKYDPTIMVWGTGDILMLDNFYKLHKLDALTTRASFINLMQLIKNYYGLKNDLGLFNALSLFDDEFTKNQDHDALEDAMVTSMVYHYFKNITQK